MRKNNKDDPIRFPLRIPLLSGHQGGFVFVAENDVTVSIDSVGLIEEQVEVGGRRVAERREPGDFGLSPDGMFSSDPLNTTMGPGRDVSVSQAANLMLM